MGSGRKGFGGGEVVASTRALAGAGEPGFPLEIGLFPGDGDGVGVADPISIEPAKPRPGNVRADETGDREPEYKH